MGEQVFSRRAGHTAKARVFPILISDHVARSLIEGYAAPNRRSEWSICSRRGCWRAVHVHAVGPWHVPG